MTEIPFNGKIIKQHLPLKSPKSVCDGGKNCNRNHVAVNALWLVKRFDHFLLLPRGAKGGGGGGGGNHETHRCNDGGGRAAAVAVPMDGWRLNCESTRVKNRNV